MFPSPESVRYPEQSKILALRNSNFTLEDINEIVELSRYIQNPAIPYNADQSERIAQLITQWRTGHPAPTTSYEATVNEIFDLLEYYLSQKSVPQPSETAPELEPQTDSEHLGSVEIDGVRLTREEYFLYLESVGFVNKKFRDDNSKTSEAYNNELSALYQSVNKVLSFWKVIASQGPNQFLEASIAQLEKVLHQFENTKKETPPDSEERRRQLVHDIVANINSRIGDEKYKLDYSALRFDQQEGLNKNEQTFLHNFFRFLFMDVFNERILNNPIKDENGYPKLHSDVNLYDITIAMVVGMDGEESTYSLLKLLDNIFPTNIIRSAFEEKNSGTFGNRLLFMHKLLSMERKINSIPFTFDYFKKMFGSTNLGGILDDPTSNSYSHYYRKFLMRAMNRPVLTKGSPAFFAEPDEMKTFKEHLGEKDDFYLGVFIDYFSNHLEAHTAMTIQKYLAQGRLDLIENYLDDQKSTNKGKYRKFITPIKQRLNEIIDALPEEYDKKYIKELAKWAFVFASYRWSCNLGKLRADPAAILGDEWGRVNHGYMEYKMKEDANRTKRARRTMKNLLYAPLISLEQYLGVKVKLPISCIELVYPQEYDEETRKDLRKKFHKKVYHEQTKTTTDFTDERILKHTIGIRFNPDKLPKDFDPVLMNVYKNMNRKLIILHKYDFSETQEAGIVKNVDTQRARLSACEKIQSGSLVKILENPNISRKEISEIVTLLRVITEIESSNPIFNEIKKSLQEKISEIQRGTPSSYPKLSDLLKELARTPQATEVLYAEIVSKETRLHFTQSENNLPAHLTETLAVAETVSMGIPREWVIWESMNDNATKIYSEAMEYVAAFAKMMLYTDHSPFPDPSVMLGKVSLKKTALQAWTSEKVQEYVHFTDEWIKRASIQISGINTEETKKKIEEFSKELELRYTCAPITNNELALKTTVEGKNPDDGDGLAYIIQNLGQYFSTALLAGQPEDGDKRLSFFMDMFRGGHDLKIRQEFQEFVRNVNKKSKMKLGEYNFFTAIVMSLFELYLDDFEPDRKDDEFNSKELSHIALALADPKNKQIVESVIPLLKRISEAGEQKITEKSLILGPKERVFVRKLYQRIIQELHLFFSTKGSQADMPSQFVKDPVNDVIYLSPSYLDQELRSRRIIGTIQYFKDSLYEKPLHSEEKDGKGH
ncbi:MAG: hypothetical protein UX04_C0002G0029 [Microgenomates group bacterium GW2011_GWF2_45_18]|nr:MAG: hypothetical protein UW18_C0001G0068 [Microgenomates group bacterium GW2011_GWF1_44_10]KKU01886.1 MAG: hypothetical protein UX04_C0002G0029 [Microgenomates group bacterium GW2011_GWF2_45_18]OGJ40263.1 MAG: hypothetical protein A2378_03530 [Candidatus Pacebacteria bacterium RIFOXYB1_FULL_44_10]HAU98797.1 hypothetical protein [Candidatus Paceibacterota bacterium]HAX01383.1 hypothetical protein [Candidatus Paceibacterota bacterium]